MDYSYITVLSNWILGYNRYTKKYSKKYSKEFLSQSTYKDQFYLLKNNEIEIGLNKAKKLIKKIDLKNNDILSNNKIIKINTKIISGVSKNTKNNLGWVIPKNYIIVDSVEIYIKDSWQHISIEDLTALSFQLKEQSFKKYEELKPRTLSFLPVAKACQAKCKFCFSESSISTEKVKKIEDFHDLNYWYSLSKKRGAERFVITGGGEPTLFGFNEINKILNISSSFFKKNVLITNGIFLKTETAEKVISLKNNGLSVLSLSCHHYDIDKNKSIMGLNTVSSFTDQN
jgi:hypothetical protein